MKFDGTAKKISTTTIPWGNYQYNILCICLKVTRNIFQDRLNDLLGGSSFVVVFLDNIVIIIALAFKD